MAHVYHRAKRDGKLKDEVFRNDYAGLKMKSKCTNHSSKKSLEEVSIWRKPIFVKKEETYVI